MVIVAAVDRSNRAETVINEATTLAEAFDESIHVVHVLTRSEFVELGRTKAEKGDSLDMEEVRSTAAKIAAEKAADLDVRHESVGLVGDPANRVVEYASNEGASYTVVSGRKKSPAGKAIFGSVAQSIILNSDRAVVSVTSNQPG